MWDNIKCLIGIIGIPEGEEKTNKAGKNGKNSSLELPKFQISMINYKTLLRDNQRPKYMKVCTLCIDWKMILLRCQFFPS